MSFWSNATTVGTQVLILFLMMGLGWFCRQRGWINADGGHQMTKVLLNIVTPCLIIHAFQGLDHAPDTMKQLGLAALFAAAAHLVGIAIGFAVFRKDAAPQRALYRFAVAFSNCGFMGIPVARAVLGEGAVVWVSLYVAVFNFFVWTVALSLFSKDKSWRKLVFNPGLIGIALGLLVYAFNLKLPDLLSTPIAAMADINTPLAMIVTGCFLYGASLLPRRGDGRMWLAIGLRLTVVPLIMLGIAVAFKLNAAVALACMVPICAPVSTMAILFPTQYDGDIDLGARMTPSSNVASALSMPLIIALAQVLIK